MTTAQAANEQRYNAGLEITSSDAYDAEYVETPEPELTEAERKALNASMAAWFGID